ncbi:MAG TPA: methyltransferase domain-containing protein [Gemmatimonadaceae bacterium]|nr:methyltransferase domain-containing protein [Gemmatimonadaceae bacterium]
MSSSNAATDIGALRDLLERRFRTVESLIVVDDRELSILHPESADELINEADFERDERLPYWADIWPSARILASYVARLDGSGRSLLELGCGAGLVATAATMAGFRVCATDYYEDALQFTTLNVAQLTGTTPETRLVDWRSLPKDLGRFDFVVGSDVLYERTYGRLVARAMDITLTRNGEAVIADPGRMAAEEFVRDAAQRGLRLIRHEQLPYVDGAIRQTISLYRLCRG